MKRSQYRQLLLILVVLILPSVAIAILGWTIVEKEREVGREQAENIQTRTIASIAKAIEAKLQDIRVNEMAADRTWTGKFSSRSVALVASMDRDELILPWEEDDPNVTQSSRDFSEGVEFPRKFAKAVRADVDGRYDQAVVYSRSLLKSAQNATQRAHALFLLARVAARSGSETASEAIYRELLKTPSSLVADGDGQPFAYYAAMKLTETHAADQDVFNRVEVDLRPESVAALRPGPASLLQDILSALEKSKDARVREGVAAISNRLSSHRHFIAQAEKFKEDLPKLQLTENEWKRYGDEGWLVGKAPTGANSRPLVIAVRGEDIYEQVKSDRRAAFSAPEFHISNTESADNQALGKKFPDLRISFEPGGDTETEQTQLHRWLYAVSLTFIVGLTLFSGCLLWRDTRRESRIAELRSQFVSSVSHELKTPLTAIRMFAEVLQMRGATDRKILSEYLEIIVNESERLTRLLTNVLDFSRIERGQKIYRFETTQLDEVVRAAARTMQYPLAEQNFVLGLNVCDGLAPVEADRDAIYQAILNLLTNAMKYSGKRRDIELRLCSEDGNALIEVTDYGIGIPEKEQAFIFEKFYRVSIPENRAISGTGLGLALVAHVAEAHRGSVRVQSSPGEGSTFSIRLPLKGGNA